MRVAVAGGTGVAGTAVVGRLRSLGHIPVVLSRSSGVDLLTPSRELDESLDGVDAVIDAGNVQTLSRRASEKFFSTVTTTLMDAEERAGVTHHVALSIVGSDRVDTGYYAGKRLQESMVRTSSVPWTIVRATQFHQFTEQALATTRGPIAMVPVMTSAPIAVEEVAERLVELALGHALSLVTQIAGPQQEHQPDLARRVLRARGSRRIVVPLRVPGAGGRAMATGGLLPDGDCVRGVETFDQWLRRESVSGR
ncbi:MAG: NAD(P)H-binding protein [Rhodococcus sp. (in: high G+C Gram-positive bacteria)]